MGQPADMTLIRNFCKNIKTSDMPFNELTQKFMAKYTLPQSKFELCMLELGKKVALNIRDLCREYYQREKEFGFFKFIKEQTPITKEFWDASIEDVKEPEPLVPLTTPLPIPQVTPAETAPTEEYSNLLPANWSEMIKTDRIAFVNKIQHEGFKNYVIGIDPGLKKYFSYKGRSTTSASKMKLYITLFQFSADNCSEESKNLLKCFIENLNSFGRTNLQFVECMNPHVIEIREMR
jgi:hypothetical protein